MLARNYRRCSTLQNATGAFVGKVPAIGFHSVVGLRRVPRCRGAIQLRVPPVPRFWGPGCWGDRASTPAHKVRSAGTALPVPVRISLHDTQSR